MRHALLHMAPKWYDNWTTRAGTLAVVHTKYVHKLIFIDRQLSVDDTVLYSMTMWQKCETVTCSREEHLLWMSTSNSCFLASSSWFMRVQLFTQQQYTNHGYNSWKWRGIINCHNWEWHTGSWLMTTTTTPQPFYGPFSRTIRVSRCQKRTSGLYGARED